MHTALSFRLYICRSLREQMYQNGCTWDGNGQCGADTQLNFCCLRPLEQCAHIQQGSFWEHTLAERASRVGYFEFHAHAHTCTRMVQGRCRGRVIVTTFFNCCCNHCVSPPALIQLLLSPHWTKAALLHWLLLAAGLHGMSAKFNGGC